MRAPEAARANARSSPFSRAAPASRSWRSFRSAASGSPSTIPGDGSCATAIGMRVIVAPGDVAPVEIAHPLLFQPKPGAAALAAARTAEAQEATKNAVKVRLAAVTASREATRATAPVRTAENLKLKAE